MDTTRASDPERERAAELLRAAVGDGRLTLSEFDERLRVAYAAVTRAELAQVTADLPASARGQAGGPTRDPEQAGAGAWADSWREWLGGALLMIAIWAAVSLARGEFNGFWPALPIGIWAAVLVASMVTRQQPAGCSGPRR